MSDEVVVLARAVLYRELARAFAYPDATLHGEPGNESAEAIRAALAALPERLELAPLAQRAIEASAALAGADVSLAEEHVRLFARQVLSPPYEASYGPDRAFGRVKDMAELASLYAAFGVRVAEREKELPDHVGVELGFLSFLCAKESYAHQTGNQDEALVCRAARGRFLTDHARRWLPALAERLTEKSRLDFFPAFASLAAAAVMLDPAGTALPADEASPAPGLPTEP